MLCCSQWPEFGIQAALTLLMMLHMKWIPGVVYFGITAYNVRLVLLNQHTTDVTEIFKQIPREKNIRFVKMMAYLLLFTFCIYKYVRRLFERMRACMLDF